MIVNAAFKFKLIGLDGNGEMMAQAAFLFNQPLQLLRVALHRIDTEQSGDQPSGIVVLRISAFRDKI